MNEPRTSARGIEDELLRIGFSAPSRTFPGWHREGIGVEVFDHPIRGEVEVLVWVIGDISRAHELVAERCNPSIRWIRNAIRKAELMPTAEERLVAAHVDEFLPETWKKL